MTTEQPGASPALSDQLGPSVPDEVMLYVHAYGDSRADDDGMSALRIGETVLALRRWAARLQAQERVKLLGLAHRVASDANRYGCEGLKMRCTISADGGLVSWEVDRA